MEKITLVEWVFIITCLFLFEILMVAIEWVSFGLGSLITVPLSWMVWALYYGYLWMRGVKLGNAKMLTGGVITFMIESLPIIGGLPTLTLNAIYTMIVSSSQKN